MQFTVIILPSADADLASFRAHEQRVILTGIATYLTYDVTIETKRRKKLDPNRIAPWELRIDHYRIFYNIEHYDC
jgi:mRNA-degrading endonuclease RelE of RelBE toxin-antitoxin system